MEPITVIAVGLFCLVRYGITDAISAARGTEPARVVARRERHERAQARGGPSVTSALAARAAALLDPSTTRPKRERGPFLRWVASVWRDSWEHAGEVHTRREEQRQAGELPRQRAWRYLRDRVQNRGGPVKAESQRLDRCDECGGTYAEHCPLCEDCQPDDECRAGTCLEVVDDPADPDQPDWWGDAPATDTPKPQPAATVHPIRPEGARTMTTASAPSGSAETYNPETGKAFAENLKANQAGVAASCETSQASLAGHVEGEALTLLAAIQERSEQSAADAEKLAEIFAKQQEAAEQAAAAGVTDRTYLHA